jgi:uroporphyrinogen-III synthase
LADGSCSGLVFVVVGNATASVLHSIQEIRSDSRFVPKDIRGNSESGTNERLTRFILEDLTKMGISKATSLYLTGDKNQDTLPRALVEGGITLTSLQVYETHGSSTFVRDLENVVESTLPGEWRPMIPYL